MSIRRSTQQKTEHYPGVLSIAVESTHMKDETTRCRPSYKILSRHVVTYRTQLGSKRGCLHLHVQNSPLPAVQTKRPEVFKLKQVLQHFQVSPFKRFQNTSVVWMLGVNTGIVWQMATYQCGCSLRRCWYNPVQEEFAHLSWDCRSSV